MLKLIAILICVTCKNPEELRRKYLFGKCVLEYQRKEKNVETLSILELKNLADKHDVPYLYSPCGFTESEELYLMDCNGQLTNAKGMTRKDFFVWVNNIMEGENKNAL